VILKLLSDRGGTESVSGRLSIGILIVQDVIVMLLFVAISTFEQLKG
jgi:predicted Kef-type K+ transport protein